MTGMQSLAILVQGALAGVHDARKCTARSAWATHHPSSTNACFQTPVSAPACRPGFSTTAPACLRLLLQALCTREMHVHLLTTCSLNSTTCSLTWDRSCRPCGFTTSSSGSLVLSGIRYQPISTCA